MFNIKMFNTKKSYFLMLIVMSVVGVGVLSSCKRKTTIKPIEQFTITFDANTGTGTMATQTFVKGVAQAITTNSFAKTGYAFSGWNTKVDATGTSYTDQQSMTITANTTLYAQWTANTYIVTFDANGGTGTIATQTFTEGVAQAITTNSFAKTGYAFAGWNTKADATGTSYTDQQSMTITANTTLYAQWTTTYTVTFDANGGTGTIATQTFTERVAQAITTNSFAKTGYSFAGWATTASGSVVYTDGQNISITQNTTLYAVWSLFETVSIPAGTFMMGSPASEPNRSNDEVQHSVTLSRGFKLSKYEITAAQYAVFLNAIGVAKVDVGQSATHTVSEYGTQTLFVVNQWGWTPKWNDATGKWETTFTSPMIYVTWYGAKAFADWVGGTLPTEAQWEYACRAGTTTAYSFGADATDIDDYCWYEGNTSEPKSVGQKLPNAWGLYDMHGSVWEWCRDSWNGSNNYASLPSIDPLCTTGALRVKRGGGWYYEAQFCRSAYRNNDYPTGIGHSVGFRVALP